MDEVKLGAAGKNRFGLFTWGEIERRKGDTRVVKRKSKEGERDAEVWKWCEGRIWGCLSGPLFLLAASGVRQGTKPSHLTLNEGLSLCLQSVGLGWAWGRQSPSPAKGTHRLMERASQYHCVSACSKPHVISNHPPFHNPSRVFFLTWLQNLSSFDFKASTAHRLIICKHLLFDLCLLFGLCLSLAYIIHWDGNEMLWEPFPNSRVCPQSSLEQSSSVHPHALYSQPTCMVPAYQLCVCSSMNETLPSLGAALSGVWKKSVKENNLLKQVLFSNKKKKLPKQRERGNG